VPTLSFEGETHDELVRKVKRWLASVEAGGHLTPTEAVEKASELTKDALGVIAAAAPGTIAERDVVKQLTKAGYELTEGTTHAVLTGLNALSEVTNGGLLKRVETARKSAVYEMNAAVARQILKALKP
jgi:methylmalonyl-CoA mutase cobalamin-binding subunit